VNRFLHRINAFWSQSDWLNKLAFGVALIFCGWSRAIYVEWDGLHQTHPDERYINLVATSIEFNFEHDEGTGPLSDLNPFYWPNKKTTDGINIPQGEARLFAYGHFPLYLRVVLAKSFEYFGNIFDFQFENSILNTLFHMDETVEIYQIAVIGRYLSALADCVTVVITYLIGRKMYGVGVGLIASLLFAVAVQFIQQAHFGTFDSLLATVVAVSIGLMISYVNSSELKYLHFAAISVGIAVGVKATAGFLAIPMLVAIVSSPILRVDNAQCVWWRKVSRVVLVPAVYAILAFGLTNPYALIEWRNYIDNIVLQSYMARGNLDWPFIIQYRETIPYIYHIVQQGQWTLGWGLTVFMYVGTAVCVIEVISNIRIGKFGKDIWAKSVVLSWVLCYFLLVGGLYVKYPRYMLPILAFQIIYAAELLLSITKRCFAVGFTTIVVVIGLSGIYAIQFLGMYKTFHPWIVASDFVYEIAENGSNILIEKWDHPLPLAGLNSRAVNTLDKKFIVSSLDLVDLPDTAEKLEFIIEEIVEGDYIILASNRNYGPVIKNTDLFPFSAKYYRGLLDGSLGYQLILVETRYPVFAGRSMRGDPIKSLGIEPVYDRVPEAVEHRPVASDESFTVYDHPMVLVFVNEMRLSYDQIVTELMN
jgi:hypothetical protein